MNHPTLVGAVRAAPGEGKSPPPTERPRSAVPVSRLRSMESTIGLNHQSNVDLDLSNMVQNIIQSPCVTALVLSEGTNSNMRLSEQLWAEQLWAEQLRTWYNLDLLHLSLCIGSYSPRGNDQQSVTVGTALSRTDPNNIELLSSKQRRWASHQKTLSAIGAAYSIRLIRALFYLH